MRLGLFAALTLAANLLAFPGTAESAFPKLQRAEPVFEKQAMKNRPSVCNGFAGYGATIEQTLQAAVVAPPGRHCRGYRSPVPAVLRGHQAGRRATAPDDRVEKLQGDEPKRYRAHGGTQAPVRLTRDLFGQLTFAPASAAALRPGFYGL